MDSILNSNFQIIPAGDFFETSPSLDLEHMSIWAKEKDIIRASTDVTLTKTLDPGIYTIGFNNDDGLYCKKLNIVSDELFLFSNSITNKLIDEINLFWSKSELYKENNLIHKRGILLEGFPGVGKSSIITLLSNEIISKGGVVFKVTGPRNLSAYIDFVQMGFRKIQPDTPIITIIEDIDQYESSEDILDFLDGKNNLEHHVLIATTNNTESVPDTFLRPSRIDLKIEIDLPDEQTRREYFQFKKVPEKDISTLVSESEGLSLADLKEIYICIYLLDYNIDDAIKKVSSPREKKNYLNASTSNSNIGI